MQKWKFWSAVPSRKSVGLLATVLALASVVGARRPWRSTMAHRQLQDSMRWIMRLLTLNAKYWGTSW